VEARRSDKSFPYTSPAIERHVGAVVADSTGARVDLSPASDLEIGVEVQPGRALVFGRVIKGPGGLPLGSQGRVVALLSGGIDSPVATWLMMKRGCGVIPVHFAASAAQSEQAQAVVEALGRYSYGWPLRLRIFSQEELLASTMNRLEQLNATRWACLMCKHAMLLKAAEIAAQEGASALVTGDSLGQVASQTLSNLEAISSGIPKPILRPLIGLDKAEIMALARTIGTYAITARREAPCPYVPARPLTHSHFARFQTLLDEMACKPAGPSERIQVEPQPVGPGPQEERAAYA
jgi:thiamine biosynthesis protein ThiI